MKVYRAGQVPENTTEAVLLVDKPAGCTSFDVIRMLRRILGVRKIGHAGTLDPMATGLLICLVGRATKRMQDFMNLPKEYQGTMRMGETTPSYDAETQPNRIVAWHHIADQDLEKVRHRFLGRIEQLPPMYSARKVKGERLYRKARRGETVDRPKNRVRVYRLDITDRNGSDISFSLACSKGTYVRTIAHDFGNALGVGAHLISLRRTAIGPHRVQEAWELPHLEAQCR